MSLFFHISLSLFILLSRLLCLKKQLHVVPRTDHFSLTTCYFKRDMVDIISCGIRSIAIHFARAYHTLHLKLNCVFVHQICTLEGVDAIWLG